MVFSIVNSFSKVRRFLKYLFHIFFWNRTTTKMYIFLDKTGFDSFLNTTIIGTVKQNSSHNEPLAACTSAQSDQILHCPLTEPFATTDCMNEEQRPDDTLRMRRMIYAHFAHVQRRFSLDAARIALHYLC